MSVKKYILFNLLSLIYGKKYILLWKENEFLIFEYLIEVEK